MNERVWLARISPTHSWVLIDHESVEAAVKAGWQVQEFVAVEPQEDDR